MKAKKNTTCEKCKGRLYHPEEKYRQTKAAKEFGLIPEPCIKNGNCPYATSQK